MADIVDQATRSRMMSSIRARDTAPERRVRQYLHAAGMRFRIEGRDLPGRPDIVLPAHRAVVLVHGCFWHRHARCRFAATPASNTAFWNSKFEKNVARDRMVAARLLDLGWRVFIVWECETTDPVRLDRLAWRILGGI